MRPCTTDNPPTIWCWKTTNQSNKKWKYDKYQDIGMLKSQKTKISQNLLLFHARVSWSLRWTGERTYTSIVSLSHQQSDNDPILNRLTLVTNDIKMLSFLINHTSIPFNSPLLPVPKPAKKLFILKCHVLSKWRWSVPPTAAHPPLNTPAPRPPPHRCSSAPLEPSCFGVMAHLRRFFAAAVVKSAGV